MIVENVEVVFEQLMASDDILIWGAGYHTKEVLRFYKSFFDRKHLQIVDKNRAGEYIEGYKIAASDTVDYAAVSFVAIMSANYHNEIEYMLKSVYGYKGLAVGLYDFRRLLLRFDSYDECKCHLDDFIKHMESGKQSYSFDYIFREKYGRFKKIKLYAFWSSSIGESIRYLTTYYDGIFKDKEEDEFYLLVPYINGNDFANGWFIEIVSRTVPMVTYENCHFWRYLLERYPECFDLENYNDYNGILVDSHNQFDERIPSGIFCDKKFPIISFTQEEEKEARNRLKKMGISGEYVCLFARDSAYLQHQYGNAYYSCNEIRNMNVETFKSASEYLDTQGIRTIRMGKVVNQSVDLPNCVDYASICHNDLMDIYLLGNCKFYAGSVSGIAELAHLLGIPVVFLGVVQARGYHSVPHRSDDIYVPKKIYDHKNKKFLNFVEMWNAELEAKDSLAQYYIEQKLEFIELSENEIRDAVVEMNEKIDGIYVEDEYEKELQQKYHALLNHWIEKNGKSFFYYQHNNISGSFIRKNAFLLEEKD